MKVDNSDFTNVKYLGVFVFSVVIKVSACHFRTPGFQAQLWLLSDSKLLLMQILGGSRDDQIAGSLPPM